MLRPLLLASAILLSSVAYSGIIGTGGSTSQLTAEQLADLLEQVQNTPELRVDQGTYDAIMRGINANPQRPIQATFRGEHMELVNLRINNRDNIVETQMRVKITK